MAENRQEFAITWRETFRLLGAGATAAQLLAAGSAANALRFPKDAIIRTVLKEDAACEPGWETTMRIPAKPNGIPG